jgi:hypothetical protein
MDTGEQLCRACLLHYILETGMNKDNNFLAQPTFQSTIFFSLILPFLALFLVPYHSPQSCVHSQYLPPSEGTSLLACRFLLLFLRKIWTFPCLIQSPLHDCAVEHDPLHLGRGRRGVGPWKAPLVLYSSRSSKHKNMSVCTRWVRGWGRSQAVFSASAQVARCSREPLLLPVCMQSCHVWKCVCHSFTRKKVRIAANKCSGYVSRIWTCEKAYACEMSPKHSRALVCCWICRVFLGACLAQAF